MLSSRQRVLCALNHEEPDRVPIFFGTSGVTTMLAPAYDRLKAYLGIHTPTVVFWRALQYALLDEEVMARFEVDARPLMSGAAPSTLEAEYSDGSFSDGWGIRWRQPAGCAYCEIMQSPLQHASIDDIAAYPWLDLSHPSRFVGLKAKAKAIQEAGYAVVALTGVSPFEYCYMLRGMEAWMLDLASNPEFVQALMAKVTQLQKQSVLRLLEEAGEYIDVVITGDDLGTQNAPMLSPAMYRKMIKPFHAELMQSIHAHTKGKIFYHSDGAIYPLIGDLIEIGVDLLNPVQVSARGMGDTARLKKEFGARLSFCGGIDNQEVLPHGTPEDVRAEVRRRIRDLAPGGGYVLSAVHCIQPDVPPENIVAMLDEARLAGRYPIRL